MKYFKLKKEANHKSGIINYEELKNITVKQPWQLFSSSRRVTDNYEKRQQL
jgi:hypothetical protein